MAELKFRIRNVSRRRGVQRVFIPIGQSILHPDFPLRPRASVRQAMKSPCTTVIGESALKRMVNYIRRGQLSVTPMGGVGMPQWLLDAVAGTNSVSTPPPPVETPVSVVETPEEEELEEEEEEEEEEEGEDTDVINFILDQGARASASAIQDLANDHPLGLADVLDDLELQEMEGKSRKTVLSAIESRREDMS